MLLFRYVNPSELVATSLKEQPEWVILETFQTFDQSDEATRPDQKNLPTYIPTYLPTYTPIYLPQRTPLRSDPSAIFECPKFGTWGRNHQNCPALGIKNGTFDGMKQPIPLVHSPGSHDTLQCNVSWEPGECTLADHLSL